jgi:hypothetical protein
VTVVANVDIRPVLMLQVTEQALLQAAAVMRLEAPNPRALSIYKSQFDQMDIRGNSAGLLDEKEDLVALRAPADSDFLSRLTRENWPFPSIAGEGQVGYFRERHLRTFVAAMSVIVAGILLIGSILTLYFVQHPDARLGLLLLYVDVTLASIHGRKSTDESTA